MEKLVALANIIAEFIETLVKAAKDFANGFAVKDFPNMK